MERRAFLWTFFLLCAAIVQPCGSGRTRGQDFADDDRISALSADDGPVHSGACDWRDRKTLFQWSYGTSFSGGASLDEPLVTDRPDFTECSTTVGRGVVQLEYGYTFFHDRDGTQTTRVDSVGEPLLRCGLVADWLEFRVATSYLHESRSCSRASISQGGASDLYLGIKIALTPQEGILPEMALTQQVLLPTGTEPFTGAGFPPPCGGDPWAPDRVAPGINWLYSWVLSDRCRIGGSSQCNRTTDEETSRWFSLASQSVVAGYTLWDDCEVYGEWISVMPIDADTTKPEHYLTGGMIYYWNNDVQFDLRGGLGMCDAADDCYVGVGGAVRFGGRRRPR